MAEKPLSGPRPSEETLALMKALLDRPDWREAADRAVERAYPDAPAVMRAAAVYHVYEDGVRAALEWVAATERFLRDPSKTIDHGATFHLLYHLYNWQQFQALLPDGRTGVIALLNDVKDLLAEDDPKAALETVKHLIDMFEAGLRPPRVESPD